MRFAVVCMLAAFGALAGDARSHAAAQTPDSGAVRLDTLLVPAARGIGAASLAPVSISIVDRSLIRDARATVGLDEALIAVPGLAVDNRQNFSIGSRVVIRGLGARAAFGVRGVRVLADGIPLTMPDGQTNLNNLDLGSAGSIHVLRGPASALFGNAAGGAIIVQTEPAPGPRSTAVRFTMGDQGRGTLTRLVKAQATITETLGSLDYLATVSRLDAKGYRDHGRARQTMVNARVGTAAGNAGRLTFTLNAVDAPIAESPGALPRDSAFQNPSMAWPTNAARRAGEATRQAQIGMRFEHGDAVNRTSIAAWGLRRTVANPLPFAYIDVERWAWGSRGQYEREVGRWTVIAGADVEAQRDDRIESDNVDGKPQGPARRNQQDRVMSIGPFVQARFNAGPFGILGGARYDAVRFRTIDRRDTVPDASGSRTLHAPSLVFGATIATNHATWFANVASAFQTPTTTELLNAPPASGEPCCPAGFNTSLEPQRAISGEIGVRSTPGTRFVWEATGFLMDVTDALVSFQVPGVDGRDFFRNAGRTRHRGIELAANARLAHGFAVAAAYALTDVRFRDDGDTTRFEGNRVPGIAPHRLFMSAGWSHPRVAVAVDARHVAAQFGDDANTAEIDGYTLLDLRAHGTFGVRAVQVAPFVALHNLLDEQYSGSVTVNAAGSRYFEPAPGRNLVIGAEIRTGAWRRDSRDSRQE